MQRAVIENLFFLWLLRLVLGRDLVGFASLHPPYTIKSLPYSKLLFDIRFDVSTEDHAVADYLDFAPATEINKAAPAVNKPIPRADESLRRLVGLAGRRLLLCFVARGTGEPPSGM